MTTLETNPVVIENGASESNLPSNSSQGLVASSRKRTPIRALTQRVKDKTKRALHLVHSDQVRDVLQQENFKAKLDADVAFDPQTTIRSSPQRASEKPSRNIRDVLFKAGETVLHPRETAREKATSIAAQRIASAQRSWGSPGLDRELVEAHDDLAKAAARVEDDEHCSDLNNDGMVQANWRVRRLEEERGSLRIAWITGRYVSRVRIVEPMANRPRKEDFRSQPSPGNPGRLQWEKWLAQLAIYYTSGFTARYIDDFESPPFDFRDLSLTVERFVLVSEPWQRFLMNVRQVYTWEDPRKTARWCVLFWLLWYTNHIVGYVYGHIIYITIRNRLRPTSVETIRQNIQRAMDREIQAQGWSDLIQQHGKADWIDPLLEQLGPLIQLRLGDVADTIEILVNFYRWERPSKTVATLFFFAVCLLITLMADMAFCVKLVWFIAGGGFFFSFPLGTNFPKYRVVVNLARWIFWDIPTFAQLSIAQLQEKAIMRDASLLQDDEDQRKSRFINGVDGVDGVDEDVFETSEASPPRPAKVLQGKVASFHVFNKLHRGRLNIRRECIEYQQKDLRRVWRFSQMTEMRKEDDIARLDKLASLTSHLAGINFMWKDEGLEEQSELILLTRKLDRDRMFNIILAWSGIKWRVLQLDRHDKRQVKDLLETFS